MLLANRTRGKPDISFGPAFVCILPRFQRPRCRPGFWPTEPVGSMTYLSDKRLSKSLRVSNGPGVGQSSGQPNPCGDRHLFPTGVCRNPSASPMAQVPARPLANRSRGKPDIAFGPAFVEIAPRFQRPRFRPGFWPTEPVESLALANRTRGEPCISFGPAFVGIPPRFQWHRCRPGFWPTEPVGSHASPRTGVYLNPPVCPAAQVPARLLANRTRGKPCISFGPAFV